LHFASCWAGFLSESDMHYVRRVKQSEMGAKTWKYLVLEQNNDLFSSKSIKRLHFASSWAGFESESDMHYVRRVKQCEMSASSSKYLVQEGNNA
jgi:hypothetical protein